MDCVYTQVLRKVDGNWVGKIVFLIFRICVNNYICWAIFNPPFLFLVIVKRKNLPIILLILIDFYIFLSKHVSCHKKNCAPYRFSLFDVYWLQIDMRSINIYTHIKINNFPLRFFFYTFLHFNKILSHFRTIVNVIPSCQTEVKIEISYHGQPYYIWTSEPGQFFLS